LLDAKRLQQQLLWQDLRDRRARQGQREIQAKTPLGARKINGVLRKQGEPKIKELRKREHEIAAIQVAQAASMSLPHPMEERAASETN
jgi:hypothetical protein